MEDLRIAEQFIDAFHKGDTKTLKKMIPTLTEKQRNNIFFEVSGNEYCELMLLGVHPTPYNVCYTFQHQPLNAVYWFSTGISLDFGYRSLTPLIAAASGGHVDLVRTLLSQGVDPNTRAGTTALCAVFHDYYHVSQENVTAIVKLLLDAGADPNIMDDQERIPLFHCRDLETARLLRAKTTDINHTTAHGENLLHAACNLFTDHLDLFYYFIEIGVRKDTLNKYGKTPIHKCCFNYERFRILLDAGSEVTEEMKRTLLSFRYDRDCCRIVALLKQRGIL